MEEQALYRAILTAPHDDAPRLVYADWLDENADAFPAPLAKTERARAEFIRLQCEAAGAGRGGWGFTTLPTGEVTARQKRLLFLHGKKWRRAFPITLSSAPFDRGFLRPFRAVRPQEFLEQYPAPHLPIRARIPPLPVESHARRYIPEMESTFLACPLWDVHLFASDWNNDPLADRGQYGDLLTEIGRSPQLERVGWLKVSFFRTSALDFLRTGKFPNVETLVLNSGPFPAILEAVTENESFRSLRYIQFGADQELWAGGYPGLLRYVALHHNIRAANQRHVPHGEMRAVLRNILRDTPIVPAATPYTAPQWPQSLGSVSAPLPQSLGFPPDTPPGRPSGLATAFVVLFGLIALICGFMGHFGKAHPPTPRFNDVPDKIAIPPNDDEKATPRTPKTRIKPMTSPPWLSAEQKNFMGPVRPGEFGNEAKK